LSYHPNQPRGSCLRETIPTVPPCFLILAKTSSRGKGEKLVCSTQTLRYEGSFSNPPISAIRLT